MEVLWKKHDCLFYRVSQYIDLLARKWKNGEKN